MDLEIHVWFKIHTNVSNFETASPKPYKLVKFFMISVIVFKMGKRSDFHLSFFHIEVAWRNFAVVIKLMKNFNFMSLYGFGGRCLKIRDVCMDFEPNFKVCNLISIYPKSIKLGQMTNLNMFFHVVVSVYWLVKIWNLPQFPAEFWNSLLVDLLGHKQICLMKNEQQSQNLLLKVDPCSTCCNNFLQPATFNVFVARQVDHTRWRGEEQNREEGKMAQKKLGGGRNSGKK